MSDNGVTHVAHNGHSTHSSPAHDWEGPHNSAVSGGTRGKGQGPGLGLAGYYSEPGATVGTGYRTEHTRGAGWARPQRPGRPRHRSPPPRACWPEGTALVSPRLPDDNRTQGQLSERLSCPTSPGDGAGPGPAEPKFLRRTHLFSGSKPVEPKSKLTQPPAQRARGPPAHFAPEVGRLRLAAS